MRATLLLGVLIGASGCSQLESEAVKRCESQLLAKLKAPSSYKRVSVHVTDINPDAPTDLKNVTERWVTLEYDAVNSYNAPLRGTETCKFPLRDGKADTGNMIDENALPVSDPITENMTADDLFPNMAEPSPQPAATPGAQDDAAEDVDDIGPGNMTEPENAIDD